MQIRFLASQASSSPPDVTSGNISQVTAAEVAPHEVGAVLLLSQADHQVLPVNLQGMLSQLVSAGCVCREVWWEPGALWGRAHVEVRALLQFHAGGTKSSGRHQHRKSCLGFNGEPHGFVVLFLFSGPKITPFWLFPPETVANRPSANRSRAPRPKFRSSLLWS